MGRSARGWACIAACAMTAATAPNALALTGPASADAAAALEPLSFTATLVRTTPTSTWDPPSPDPTGITYLANRDRLLISDSEVEEMPIYAGVNLFSATRAGARTGGARSTRFTNEPTGLGYNPANGHLFVSDDQADEIYEVAPGRDGRHGTADDRVTSFDTRSAGNSDPEGVEFDSDTGHVLVVDGVGTEVYRYAAGVNGRFDGIPPRSDDTVTHFDVGVYGARDPEGIAYDNVRKTILVLDFKSQKIYELASTGLLLNTISVSALLGTTSVSAAKPTMPAGLTVAPASDGSGRRNLYIVDRGLDNDAHPRENDGRLYEMSVSLPPRR
jgi:hypothetical protein